MLRIELRVTEISARWRFDQRHGKFNSVTIVEFWKIRGDLAFISRNNVSLISLKRLLYNLWSSHRYSWQRDETRGKQSKGKWEDQRVEIFLLEFNAETFPFLSIWIFIRFDKLIGEIFRKSLEIEDGVEIMIFTLSLTRRQFININFCKYYNFKKWKISFLFLKWYVIKNIYIQKCMMKCTNVIL